MCGVYEAIYFGVPMVGIPVFHDQHDNAIKIKQKGIGEIVDKLTSPEVLMKTATKVLNNSM